MSHYYVQDYWNEKEAKKERRKNRVRTIINNICATAIVAALFFTFEYIASVIENM